MLVTRPFLVLMVSLVLSSLPVPVHAGTPYTCLCDGKKQRSIASTYFCGHRKPACTRKEFNAFRAKACAADGCNVAR